MDRHIIIVSICLFAGYFYPNLQSRAQPIDNGDLKLILLRPTGETFDELPVMELIPDTAHAYKKVNQTIRTSFVGEFLDLYRHFQSYLKVHSKIDSIEPAYLALSELDGGYARFGFFLRTPKGLLKKAGTPYIDITENRSTGNPNKLMSFTQLFPHEMGHVFFHELCREDSSGYNTKSVNMHFFPIVTDYATAMNEGFAEHIENVARLFEKNSTIKEGIMQDTIKIRRRSGQFIKGFENDLKYPFRMGYYKGTMIYWFQQYEDLRRYQQAISGEIRFKNKNLSIHNTKDRLTYRNSGVYLNRQELRNPVQMHATEGVISAFFTALTSSELGNHYLDSTFYQPFLPQYTHERKSPKEYFNPWQNQFLKYFRVLHDFVTANNAKTSQFTDFIEGYIQLFPGEKKKILAIYKNVLGMEYAPSLPPPVWVLVKDYDHRLVVFDPFDAITIPIYTFDLNAAEVEDLLTIKKIHPAEATKIIQFRNKNGFFSSIDELRSIPGVSDKSMNAILSSKMDERYFENLLEEYEPQLNLKGLIIKPLKYLLIRSFLYFGIVMVVMILIIRKQSHTSLKRFIWLIFRYGVLWILFIITGLLLVFIAWQPVLAFLGFLVCITGLTWLIYRNRIIPRNYSLISLLLMGIMVLISLF